MALEFIRLSSPLPASSSRVYDAWLDGAEHSLMTGGQATVEAKIGGRHTAWDGYIEGEILELEPGRRIVQTWRSSEFPAGHPHSLLEIRFRDTPAGCEVLLAHSDIPEGQGERYEAGWHEHYFIPMTRYFRGSSLPPSPPPADDAKVAPAKKAVKAKPAAAKKKVAAKKVAAKKKVVAKKKVAPKKKVVPKRAGSPKKKPQMAAKKGKEKTKKKKGARSTRR
jgi:uncharacterized protein YndB with AHSA1/START domain